MWPWATSTQCHCSLIACRWQSLFRTHRWSRPCFPSTCGMWTGDLWAAATMASLFTQAAAGAGADFIKMFHFSFSTFTQNTGNEKITIWSQSLQLNDSRHTTDFFIFLNVTNVKIKTIHVWRPDSGELCLTETRSQRSSRTSRTRRTTRTGWHWCKWTCSLGFGLFDLVTLFFVDNQFRRSLTLQ